MVDSENHVASHQSSSANRGESLLKNHVPKAKDPTASAVAYNHRPAPGMRASYSTSWNATMNVPVGPKLPTVRKADDSMLAAK